MALLASVRNIYCLFYYYFLIVFIIFGLCQGIEMYPVSCIVVCSKYCLLISLSFIITKSINEAALFCLQITKTTLGYHYSVAIKNYDRRNFLLCLTLKWFYNVKERLKIFWNTLFWNIILYFEVFGYAVLDSWDEGSHCYE